VAVRERERVTIPAKLFSRYQRRLPEVNEAIVAV